MTRTELDTLLRTLDCGVYYNHTTRKGVVSLPFIVYLDNGTDNFMADNKVHKEITNYLIIIHSASRDTTLETSLKTLLNNNSLPYEINDIDWDEDLNMWKVSYNIQL